jgi:hypothetical protein
MHPTLEKRLRGVALAGAIAVSSLCLSGCANQWMYHVDGINPYTNTPVGTGNGQANVIYKTPEERAAETARNEDFQRRRAAGQLTPDELRMIEQADRELDKAYKKMGRPNPFRTSQ